MATGSKASDTVVTTFLIGHADHDWLKDRAKRDQRTMSATVRLLIDRERAREADERSVA